VGVVVFVVVAGPSVLRLSKGEWAVMAKTAPPSCIRAARGLTEDRWVAHLSCVQVEWAVMAKMAPRSRIRATRGEVLR
jgi:hypothetical protein